MTNTLARYKNDSKETFFNPYDVEQITLSEHSEKSWATDELEVTIYYLYLGFRSGRDTTLSFHDAKSRKVWADDLKDFIEGKIADSRILFNDTKENTPGASLGTVLDGVQFARIAGEAKVGKDAVESSQDVATSLAKQHVLNDEDQRSSEEK